MSSLSISLVFPLTNWKSIDIVPIGFKPIYTFNWNQNNDDLQRFTFRFLTSGHLSIDYENEKSNCDGTFFSII